MVLKRLAIALIALLPEAALAQSLPQPQVITQPQNDNSNRAASTGYVDRATSALSSGITTNASAIASEQARAQAAEARLLSSTGDASASTVISALGSASRALKNRFLDGGASVLDFGPFVGTGGDDSAALNAALRASCAYTQTNPAAKTCKLILPEPPSGAYNVCASPITLPGYWSSVMIQGTGAAPKVRVLPGCTSGIQAVIYQALNTGDSSAARLHIDNLTLDSYCIAPNNLYLGYVVGAQITRSIFRNVKGGAGNSNIVIGGGYENNIDKSNRAENVNEPGHTCYNSQSDLPDYNLITRSSDSWYGLAAVDAKIANYYNANGGNNHYADAHGWGFTGAFPPYASGNLAPKYTFLIVGNADINGAVLDSPQVAGVFLKGGNDTNGNPTNASFALVSGTYIFGSPAGTPAVLLDTGLTNATIVGNGWGNQTSAVATVSGGISPSIVIANNGDASPVASTVIASPVKGGDTAALTAYGPGGGIGLVAQSPSANSGVYINAKGAAAVQLNSNSAVAFSAYANPGSVNFLGATANSSGSSPVLQAIGGDTNISLPLLGKGTSGVLTGVFARTTDPTTTDIPAGQCADWNNTTAATFKHVCNFGGTLRSVAMN